MSKKKDREEYPEMPDMIETTSDYGMMPGGGPGYSPGCGPGMGPVIPPGMGPGMPCQGMGMYCFCIPFPMNPCDHGMMPGMIPDYSMMPIYDYDENYFPGYPMMPDDC